MQNYYDKLKSDDNSELICDSDDSMPSTERELADDAQWKLIQKNTFTRWVNVHLKKANTSIKDLQTDFSDGLKLVALIEVLSGHKFAHVNKRTNFITQKLENVTMVLDFLEKNEGIRLVNIDSSDIVESRLKLILGLIWSLILHYSISMPIWGDEESKEEVEDTKQTPKQRMMSWINGKLPGNEVRNLTTDWNDGKAIGALVDSCAPGLCPDWSEWRGANALENTKEAMDTAEQWLNVPQLIRPEEMIDPKVDEKAMMTYLSQFPHAQLKPGAPLRSKLNPNKVRVYGPGVESKDLKVTQETEFFVDAFTAGKGALNVQIVNSKREYIEVVIEEYQEKPNFYKCFYTPTTKGQYTITVKYAGDEIPNSPFKVSIDKVPTDLSKVVVYGPGIDKDGVKTNQKTHFNIDVKEAGSGEISLAIIDPNKRNDSCKFTITDKQPGVHTVEYIPVVSGMHSINILFDNQQIPGSPFPVKVTPRSNARSVIVSGRGIQSDGIRVGDNVTFYVDTSNAGEGDLSINLIDGNKKPVNVKQLEQRSNYYECLYIPPKEGLYKLEVKYDGEQVNRSPFQIKVLPKKQSKIRAFGHGLETGMVDKPAVFVVDTNEDLGTLGFSIEGPSQAKIECCDNQDGSATVCYWPTTEGEYAVHVLCNGEDIPNSPFMANILPKSKKTDVSKIKVYGNGVMQNKVVMDNLNDFTIDYSDYKEDNKPKVKIYDSIGEELTVKMSQISTSGSSLNRKFHCKYQPQHPGNYKIFITCDDQAVDKSPYRVNVSEPAVPANVRVIGSGIKEAVRHQPAKFSVDTTNAGRGNLTVELTDELGNSLPLNISNSADSDVFDVSYTPLTAGPLYTCTILYNGVSIPQSPFQIDIQPDINVSQVFVESLESKVFQESFLRFVVNAKAIDQTGKGNVKAIFTDPSGYKSASTIKNNGNGTYSCSYSPYDAGLYKLDVTYDDLSIPKSPFNLEVVPGCDPNRIRVYGDGLEGGFTNQSNVFTIDLDGAGQGNLGLAIEGPSDAKISCSDNMDGTCTVEYQSSLPGTYDIYIKFNDVDIKDCPIKVSIMDHINPDNVKCFGEAFNPDQIHRVKQPIKFVVDATRAGNAPLEITCKNNQGRLRKIDVIERENAMPGLFDVCFVPEEVGTHCIEIKFADRHVAETPMNINVLPKSEPNKVRIFGEGVKPNNGYLLPSQSVHAYIDISEAGQGEIQLSLTDPDGEMMPIEVINEGNGIFCCQYTPQQAGQYCLAASFDNIAIPSSPCYVTVKPVGMAKQCFIEDGAREYVPVETELMITINTAAAGDAKLFCTVVPTTAGGAYKPYQESLPTDIEDNGNGTHCIYYTIPEVGQYLVDIKYGGVSIPNGKFLQNAVDPDNLPEEYTQMEKSKALESTQNGFSQSNYGLYPVEFKLPKMSGDVVKATVITPSGQKNAGYVEDNGNGTVTVRYEPREQGMHEMIVTCDDRPIQGSPYRFYAELAGLGKVAAYGTGLVHAHTGIPAEFTIITKDAGSGGLSLAIEGPSKAEIVCRDNENGSCDVTYYPMIPGDYNIIIKFADKHIPGSPFLANVVGEPQRRSNLRIGSTSDVPLKIQNLDVSTLTASVRAPSGKEEPCILKKMPSDNLGISFTPKECGDHYINVYQSGSHIVGSPFKIVVGQNEIGDASKVRVYGDGLKHGKSNEPNTFIVDTGEAGYGGLSLSIEGPSKSEIECRDNHDGTCQVSYIPSEPGTYMCNIKYANEHVLGSPFAVKITGDASAKLMEKIIRRQEAADITQVGSQCELTLKIPGTNPLDMKATVTNQSGVTEICDILDLDDGHYSIKFVPKEMGLHTVVVQHKNVHIPGSPFQFTVGPIVDGGAHKVVASGPGLKLGHLSQANEFSIYTREAGAGGLSIAVEGPSKAEIDFEDRKDGSCNVKYRVTEPGEYLCSVKFNDEHILNSPFRIMVYETPVDYISMATVGQSMHRDWTIGKPAAFTVNYNKETRGQPKLKAIIVGPSGSEEPAIIQNIEKGQYAIRFMPKENGEHLIHVTDEQSGHHIPGSPFRVTIGSQHADPSMVQAYGEGLQSGLVNKKNSFVVNTTNSGTGALNVTVDGPSKVQLYSQEHEDGYEFIYVASVPGDYQITVKYGGNFHIAGSPFTAHIKGSISSSGAIKYANDHQSHLQVDAVSKTAVTSSMTSRTYDNNKANKITCDGIGLKRAKLNDVNTFNVDASKAGNDILFVGIAGPRTQCEEVLLKHLGQNRFIINYRVQERGRHHLIVKWGDSNIPGSPFVVDVV